MAPTGKASAVEKGKGKAAVPRIKDPKRIAAIRRAKTWYDSNLFFSRECYDLYIQLCDYGTMLDSYALESDSLESLGFKEAFGVFEKQHCSLLMLNSAPSYFDETCQFYANLTLGERGTYDTMVNGEVINISWKKINDLIGCPYKSDSELYPADVNGPYNIHFTGKWPKDEELPGDLNRKALAERYFGRSVVRHDAAADTYKLAYLNVEDRLVYDMVHRCLVPTGGNVTEPNCCTAITFFYVILGKPINPGYTILHHMLNVQKVAREDKNMPYGSLITKLLLKKHRHFKFNSSPTPCIIFKKKYFEDRHFRLIDGRWMNMPLKEKNKRSRVPRVEKELEEWDVIYHRLKVIKSDCKKFRRRAYKLEKKDRAVNRAFKARSFDVDKDLSP